MIAIESQDGDLVKIVNNVMDSEFGFHRVFGFISKENAEKRMTARKRNGYDFTNSDWHCSFKLNSKDGNVSLSNLTGCEAVKKGGAWSLDTPLGNFNLNTQTNATAHDFLVDHEDTNGWLDNTIALFFLLAFILIPILYFLQATEVEEEIEKEKIIEPITVKIIKQVKTVKIANVVKPNIKAKPLTKAEKSNRAVKRNLSFLGMLGSKDMKKVVGGVPTKLKNATAGAGAGGDAGSGGEVLTGLGKGLKKTTVGNTGVQGLGGVGTKGAGGGKGGYGNTNVASGEGRGISAISVSSNQMVLQGGISRYAINATIAKYLAQVRRCYEKQLQITPNIQGLVEMSFQINSSGRLNYAKVKRSTLKNKPTESCISKKMMAWDFPKPKGGVTQAVNYPFMLRPSGL
jgi:hypothetical protein